MLTPIQAGSVRLLLLALIAVCGCNGFGAGNATEPGSTPNVAAQTSFKVIGNLGTPFIATVSDQRSSWVLNGVVPLNIIIANGNFPVRIAATKLTNDNSLLSVEVINGFGVAALTSTIANYGTAVGSLNGKLPAFAPPASPDVRFFLNGPANAIYNAIVEDSSTAFVLQSRIPCVILFDSPDNNSLNAHVDGIFNVVGGAGGPLAIDLNFNGQLVQGGGSGTVTVKIH